jgi:hypothetical protein
MNSNGMDEEELIPDWLVEADVERVINRTSSASAKQTAAMTAMKAEMAELRADLARALSRLCVVEAEVAALKSAGGKAPDAPPVDLNVNGAAQESVNGAAQDACSLRPALEEAGLLEFLPAFREEELTPELLLSMGDGLAKFTGELGLSAEQASQLADVLRAGAYRTVAPSGDNSLDTAADAAAAGAPDEEPSEMRASLARAGLLHFLPAFQVRRSVSTVGLQAWRLSPCQKPRLGMAWFASRRGSRRGCSRASVAWTRGGELAVLASRVCRRRRSSRPSCCSAWATGWASSCESSGCRLSRRASSPTRCARVRKGLPEVVVLPK